MKGINSKNIYWIGGSPCSGKSSIAELLTEKYGFIYYKCDDAYINHMKKCQKELQPTMSRLKNMSLNDIFSRPVDQQVEETIMFYLEEFGLILDDIASIFSNKPILVEGAALLPKYVSPFMATNNHGVWIIPTPEFQVKQYTKREWIHSILQECLDPKQSFENWMNRDIKFAQIIQNDARSRNLQIIIVDGSTSLDENLTIVEEYFNLTN